MSQTIIVTEPEYTKARHVFDETEGFEVRTCPVAEEVLAAMVAEFLPAGVVLGVERYRGALYEAMPPGTAMSRFGVGHDGLDKQRATVGRIVVTNTPGVLDVAVAEHAMALVLGLAKKLPRFVRAASEAKWQPRLTRELHGRTLAVIGCGAIGRRLAGMAHFGFGMCVVGCDLPSCNAESRLEAYGLERFTSDFSEAVRHAEVVSLHIPATAENHNFINRERIAQIKPGALLINTARGAVVDEQALYDALSSGHLGGAGLDVFREEPYRPEEMTRDLRRLPTVLMTPHVGSNTAEACERMARRAVENIRLVHAGRYGEADVVNSEVLPLLQP